MAETTGADGAPAGPAGGGARSVKHTVTARTKARRRAVEILFEADQRGLLRRRRGDMTVGDDEWAGEVEDSRPEDDPPAPAAGRAVDAPAPDVTGGAPARPSAAQRLREFAAERAVHSANHTQAPAYTREILTGVADHLAQIDEIIETYSQGWVLHRMPAVDRAIARLSTWEIVFNDEVDAPVALDEAMTLARMLSTDESPRYLGGLLGRIGDLADTLR